MFEVRGVASAAERDYLLKQPPYDCGSEVETRLLTSVGGIEVRQVQRWPLFRWLPASVSFCGTIAEDGVLRHVSGFATEGVWAREQAGLTRMLEQWEVHRERVKIDPAGCRLDVEHELPLYVQFNSEQLAEQGVVSAQTVRWIDLPFRGPDSIGRFTPQMLQEEAEACARHQAAFAEQVDAGGGRTPEALDAQHAFMAHCQPLFPTLQYLGAGERFDPEALPTILSGWTYALDERYQPAMCLSRQQP